jgi:hypothetical protein
MKIKLEFMLPDVDAAELAGDQMLLARVEDKYIHFLAKPGTDLGDLQHATAIEKTNIIHEGERGLLIGAGLGFLAGIYVLTVPAWLTYSPLWFTNSPWYIVLATTTIFGAIFVAIGAAMLGVNLFNSDLAKHKTVIQQGGVLMIVAVPFYRAQEIRKVMVKSRLMT